MTDSSTDRWDVLPEANALLAAGEEFALATVVWRQGPSSGQTGSRAIITADGRLRGWIGGACAEPLVIAEARRVLERGEPTLLLLGQPEQFGGAVPEGMSVVPISCQSEGALQVYVEPVVPSPQLIVVGRSPMVHTLRDLAVVLGWRCEVRDGPEFAGYEIPAGAVVIIATQGHGDEEAVEHAVAADLVFVGLVASARRGAAVKQYLADRGVTAERIELVRAPVGLDLGHTTHREIAVSVLAELVQQRAAGRLRRPLSGAEPVSPTAVDPVCGMTVTIGPDTISFEHQGVTYHFCAPGCRRAFAADPASFLEESRC